MDCELDEPLRLSSSVALERGDMLPTCSVLRARLLILSVYLFSDLFLAVRGKYASKVSRERCCSTTTCMKLSSTGLAACGMKVYESQFSVSMTHGAWIPIEAVLCFRSRVVSYLLPHQCAIGQ